MITKGMAIPPGRHADVLQHLGGSLYAQWRRYRRQVRECRRHFSKREVHDSRVAARRLLSTLELLSPFLTPREVRKISRTLKDYLDIFGDLRDTQVQLASVKRLTKEHPAAAKFRRWLKKREARFARKACQAVERFKTKPLRQGIAALEKELYQCRRATPRRAAFDRALHALTRAFTRTARLQHNVKPADTATIHKTRVAFKRFRYMVETMASQLAVTDKDCQAMHDFQSMLGDIQDRQVLLETLDKFLDKRKKRAARLQPLQHQLEQEQKDLIRIYLSNAGRLQLFHPPTPPKFKPSTKLLKPRLKT